MQLIAGFQKHLASRKEARVSWSPAADGLVAIQHVCLWGTGEGP